MCPMKRTEKPLVVACLPAFNEERSIGRIVLQAERHVDRVLVCDDGSQDMTAEIAQRLGADVLRHERNLGYGVALRTLFRRALEMGADVVVTLDADGQHSPGDIPTVTKPILDGEAHLCIGSRFLGSEADIPGYRKRGIRFLTRVTSAATGFELTDAQSGFRAYSRKALRSIVPSEQGMGAGAEILQKAAQSGLRVTEAPISIRYGAGDTSTHQPVYHGLDVLGSTLKHLSIRHPLLFYGVPATVFIAVGVAFGFWALQIYAATAQLVTNLTLISLTSLIIGLILGTTAVILFTLVTVLREM